MAAFEKFRRSSAASSDRPSVTITRRGLIALNRAAFDALGAPDNVELLYDRTARRLGIRVTPDDDPDGFAVRASASRTGAPFMITAIAFTKHFGIDTSTAMRWTAALDGDTLCADLGRAGTPVTSNRLAASE